MASWLSADRNASSVVARKTSESAGSDAIGGMSELVKVKPYPARDAYRKRSLCRRTRRENGIMCVFHVVIAKTSKTFLGPTNTPILFKAYGRDDKSEFDNSTIKVDQVFPSRLDA